MQPNANTEGDRASEVIPEIKHTAPWRVISVTARKAVPSLKLFEEKCRRVYLAAFPNKSSNIF